VQQAEEKLVKIPVRETRLLFLLGYILRIFPLLSIAGSALTFIGWLKLRIRTGSSAYLYGAAASLALLVVAAYTAAGSVYTALFGTIAVEVNPIAPLEDLRRQVVEAVSAVKGVLSSPSRYMVDAVTGAALLLEAVSINQLIRDTKRLIGKYFVALFIAIGVLFITASVLQPLTAPQLDGIAEKAERALSQQELAAAVVELALALLPILAVYLIALVASLVTFILFGVKYWRLHAKLVRLEEMIRSGGAESLELV